MHRLLEQAREVLSIEARAVDEVRRRLGGEFIKALRLAKGCRGRVVVTGLGKSGLVGRKIASTLSATGTPAFYIHPVESLHGEMGVLMRGDLILAVSYSGSTQPVSDLIRAIRRLRLKLVVMTGNLHSPLAKWADAVLNIRVEREACPYNITPSASTTAAMALGDALAIGLLKMRGLKARHFSRLHPDGTLARRADLKVRDLMHAGADNPVIRQESGVQQAILVMTSKRLGAVSVVDKRGVLTGYFTDGDLRRQLAQEPGLLRRKLRDVMTKNPQSITPDRPAVEALEVFQAQNFDNMPVVDKKGRPVGMIDERDLISQGLV